MVILGELSFGCASSIWPVQHQYQPEENMVATRENKCLGFLSALPLMGWMAANGERTKARRPMNLLYNLAKRAIQSERIDRA